MSALGQVIKTRNERRRYNAFLRALLTLALLSGLAACSPKIRDQETAGPVAPLPGNRTVTLSVDGDMDAGMISSGHRIHSAVSQVYRWFLFYDATDGKLDHHLDTLAVSATFRSPEGTFPTRDDYAVDIFDVPTEWQHAHFVRRMSARFVDPDRVRLNADITYLNRGLLEGDAIQSSNLVFDFLVARDSNPLPAIEELSVQARQVGQTTEFRSSYVENRMRSLLHHWLALVEQLDTNPELLREILRPQLIEQFPATGLTDLDWLPSRAAAGSSIHYRVRNVEIEEFQPGEFQIDADLDWYALTPNGKIVRGEVLQTLLVIDDPTRRYPQIGSITELPRTPEDLVEVGANGI